MIRAQAFAVLCLAVPLTAAVQSRGVLQIRIVVQDAVGRATPVARHVLLVSDTPPSAPPQRIVTAVDGTAAVPLRPGRYTVESDRPVVFEGRTYQWTQPVEVMAGRDTVLTLTADNAEVESAASATSATEADPASVLLQWQASVFSLWTPTTRTSGFLVDPNGLVATSQRAIGAATSVQVQIAPTLKVGAIVLAADAERDVAVLWIDAKAAEAVRPIALPCTEPAPVASGQRIFAVGARFRQQTSLTSATVAGTGAHTILADLILPTGSAGGPVFTSRGVVMGLTSALNEAAARTGEDIRVVPIADVCAVVGAAAKQMSAATRPDGTALPVEPTRRFPTEALDEAARGRTNHVAPYSFSSSAFDVGFITPVLLYAAENRSRLPAVERSGATPTRAELEALVRSLTEFSNWSAYVADLPPVLMIRVTPKLVEGFWARVARGAARTQGVTVPPIKRFAAGFTRMRTFCGNAEVTPIHPFKVEQRVGESEAIHEGLYVFDPDALGPHCESVKLVLYSDKEPQKGDTRVVDPKVIRQVWQDFAPYRALK